MQTLPSPKPDPQKLFRTAILNGLVPPATIVAALEARGIDVGELEYRILHNIGINR